MNLFYVVLTSRTYRRTEGIVTDELSFTMVNHKVPQKMYTLSVDAKHFIQHLIYTKITLQHQHLKLKLGLVFPLVDLNSTQRIPWRAALKLRSAVPTGVRFNKSLPTRLLGQNYC